jgi:hypothetical protein
MQMTYEQWVAKVDQVLTSRVGLSMDDLPDWLSRDAFEDGLSPEEGADICLEETEMF